MQLNISFNVHRETLAIKLLDFGVQNFKYQSRFIIIIIHAYVTLMLIKLLILEHSTKGLKWWKSKYFSFIEIIKSELSRFIL